jgi:phytoene dehydrogenase-like protein
MQTGTICGQNAKASRPSVTGPSPCAQAATSGASWWARDWVNSAGPRARPRWRAAGRRARTADECSSGPDEVAHRAEVTQEPPLDRSSNASGCSSPPGPDATSWSESVTPARAERSGGGDVPWVAVQEVTGVAAALAIIPGDWFPSAMSQEPGRRRHMCMRQHDKEAVVVIGAGLAGLTAAATAARAGKPVVVVEAHTAGGRASTDERSGYRFNQGPHALCRGGEAWRVLRDLGVPHRGHRPPLSGARVVRNGQLVRPPGGTMSSLAARLLTTSAAKWAGRSAEDWVESLGGSRDLSDLARMLVRVTTYVTDLGAMPADFAISRIKAARRGVSYLDEGFASLVEGLSSAASAAGATIRAHQAAAGISAVPGGWEVALAGDEVLPVAAVVVAAGGPAAARTLLPVDPGWPELGPPVTAACLDLGLRGPHPSVVMGLDEPLYLARHCPPGDLAPAGGSVVHVMRYGAREAGLDRAELHRFANLAGITDDQIVEERFLAVHVVTHVLPRPEQGLAGRPGVALPGSPGLYLAGDWVGPSGWLSDAAMASGQRAGMLAAGVPAQERSYPRVA